MQVISVWFKWRLACPDPGKCQPSYISDREHEHQAYLISRYQYVRTLVDVYCEHSDQRCKAITAAVTQKNLAIQIEGKQRECCSNENGEKWRQLAPRAYQQNK